MFDGSRVNDANLEMCGRHHQLTVASKVRLAVEASRRATSPTVYKSTLFVNESQATTALLHLPSLAQLVPGLVVVISSC